MDLMGFQKIAINANIASTGVRFAVVLLSLFPVISPIFPIINKDRTRQNKTLKMYINEPTKTPFPLIDIKKVLMMNAINNKPEITTIDQ